MMKFTINPDTESKTHIFKKDHVIIGAADSHEADLSLTVDHLKNAHIKISKEKDGSYYCINLANDPFVTINDVPFGKKLLKNCDLLQIDNMVIRFEIVEEIHEPANKKSETSELKKDFAPPPSEPVRLFAAEENEKFDISSLFPDDFFEKSADHTLDDMDIEDLVREIEQLDSEGGPLISETETLVEDLSTPEEPTPPPVAEKANPAVIKPAEETKAGKKNVSIVDLPDNEKESTPENEESADKPSKLEKSRQKSANHRIKITLAMLMGATAIFLMLFNGVVTRIKEKNNREEMQAAASLADIALALTYAQINHIKPEQQNWTDPAFLKHSIDSVLSPYHEAVVDIDTHGRINNGQYLLRIYTNRDLSRYLVLAQPEPSLMQWIAPQESIAIHSSNLELHRIHDLKPLNRLLVNPDSLSGENGQEIAKLIAKEKLIPLASLANKNNRNGFMPPKGLEMIHRGAENYVYNAPRYSQVGDNIIHDAIELASRNGTISEIKRIQEQLGVISHLPYAVLYTSKGKQVAIQGQKALNTLLPHQKFLIAYLNFDNDGIVEGSNLIPDVLNPKSAPFSAMAINSNFNELEGSVSQPLALAGKATEFFTQPKKSPVSSVKSDFNVNLDEESPLYKQVMALAEERRDELSPIATQLIDLINENTENQLPDFATKLKALLAKYRESSDDQSEAIIVTLKELYTEYENMPLSEFLGYVKVAGLSPIAESHLIKMSKEKDSNTLTKEEFAHQLEKISATETFDDLYKVAKETAQELKLYNIPDTNRLILYQNQMRTQVLEKLNEMLFSPDSSLTDAELNAKNRQILQEILQISWITDADEQNFYLNEYDILAEEKERKAR